MNAQALTTVAPEERAAQLLSFEATKAELTELAKQSERITQITNKAGRDECHSSLMVLKGRRVDIEKRGKEARDDANKFAKAVIAKEKELIGFIAPEEERLQLLRDQWDTAAEVARLEKMEAERLRVEAIQQKIQQIRDVPGSMVGKPSVIIAGQLANLRATVLDEAELGADYLTATDALTAAIARVEQLLAAQQEADAEKKRQAERDAEMEAMRVKMAEQQRLIDEAEEAKRVEQERLAQVERDRVAAEQRIRDSRLAKIERIRNPLQYPDAVLASADLRAAIERGQELARTEFTEANWGDLLDEVEAAWSEAHDTLQGALHFALAREQDEADAQAARIAQEAADQAAREQEEVRLQAERDRQAAEQRKLDAQAEKLRKEKAEAAKKAEADRLANLGLREAAQAVVKYFAFFEASGDTSPDCVKDLAAALANEEAPAKPARTKRVAKA